MSQKTRRPQRVESLTKWEVGDYNLRVGDLWKRDSKVIVIAGIYLHMYGNQEWHSLEYYYLDENKGCYITDNPVSFINRVKMIPVIV